MRQGEACRLRRDDVDLDGRDARAHRHQVRQVPAGAPAPDRDRRAARLRAGPRPGVPGTRRGRVPRLQPRHPAGREQHPPHLRRARRSGRNPGPARAASPALHDLRHTFAVATLLDWYRDGADVQARLPLLSTWLGHVDPKSTYWYLQAVPELLALAAGRLERGGRAGGLVTDLAPILQGFFTDRLTRQKKASPNTVAAYRDTCRLLLAFAHQQDRQAAQQAQPRRPRRHADRRVPAAPGRRARQRQRHPQRPAGRDPLPVPLRRPAGTRARRRDQPGPGHPAPTPRARHRQLPHSRRNRRAARRTRPGNLAQPPRPRPDPARRPDRTAGIRTHRPHPPDAHLSASRTSAATAKDAKTGQHPLTSQTVKMLGPGSPSATPTRTARCSPPAEASSPATPSNGSSPSTQPRQSRQPVDQGEERHPHTLRQPPPCRPQRRSNTSVIALWLGHENAETTQIYLHAE